MFYFQSKQLVLFDSQAIMSQPSWFDKVSIAIDNSATVTKPLLVIIKDDACICSIRANKHITDLTQYAESHQLAVKEVTISKELRAIIPATPMAVLVNKNKELVYAGPLSEGLACSSGSGFVELAINNLQAGFNTNLKLSQAKGCYCH